MKYLLLIFSSICFCSCNDLHKKVYETFHANKDSTVTSSTLHLTPEEEKDDTNSGATTWANAGIEDVIGLKNFIKKLQQWNEQNNKDSIAASIQYPLLNDKKISSAKIFLQQYDKFFNEKVKKALQQQKLNRLFRNYHGVMIGNGDLWITNISETDKENYKITSINYAP